MKNGPLNPIFRVLRHTVSSAAEAELVVLFHHVQTMIPLRTTLEELGHQQPPTPLETDNTTALGIVDSTVKQKNPNQRT